MRQSGYPVCNRRRGEHGLNEIKGKGPDPLWKKYLEQVCPILYNLFLY